MTMSAEPCQKLLIHIVSLSAYQSLLFVNYINCKVANNEHRSSAATNPTNDHSASITYLRDGLPRYVNAGIAQSVHLRYSVNNVATSATVVAASNTFPTRIAVRCARLRYDAVCISDGTVAMQAQHYCVYLLQDRRYPRQTGVLSSAAEVAAVRVNHDGFNIQQGHLNARFKRRGEGRCC